MKQAKKVVSLLMALTMLIGMMTAVTVSAAVQTWEVVGSVIDFEAVDEGKAPSNIIYSGGEGSNILCFKDEGSMAAKVYGVAGSANNMFRATTYEYYSLTEGETYRISAKVKAVRQDSTSRGIQLQWNSKSTFQTIVGAENRWSTWKYHLPTDWKTYTWEYTVPAGGAGSGRIMFMFDPDSNFTNEEEELAKNVVWIDDIKVEKLTAKPEVTVNIIDAANGTVTNGQVAVASGDKIAVTQGADLTLSVTPASGYYATATVDGVAKNIVNNQITLEDVSADSTVEIVFSPVGWELIKNYDFEGHTVGATTSSEFNVSSDQMICETDNYGSKVLKASGTSNNVFRFTTKDSFELQQGETYQFSARIKAVRQDSTSRGVQVANNTTAVGFETITGAENRWSAKKYHLPTEWKTYEWTLTPASTMTTTLLIMLDADTNYTTADEELAKNVVWIDDIKLYKKLAITESDVTVTANEGGSVTYEGNPVTEAFTVANGTEVTLTAVPTEGYSISAITVDGEVVEHDNGAFTFTVDADTEVDVTFAKITNNVTVSVVGEGGTVNYDGEPVEAPIPVEYGDSVELTIVPDEGYDIATVTVGGEVVEATEVITVSNVIAATEVAVTFVKETRTVTVTANEGGSVTYNNEDAPESFTVEYGTDVTLVVTPDNNYKVAVEVNEETYVPTANNEVTFTVTEDTAVSVTFTEKEPVYAKIDATTAQFMAPNGVPTIFVYSKLNLFTEVAGSYYGIKLWNTANPNAVVDLYAHADKDTRATAEPGAQFAIRAYGKAIQAGQEYGIQAFVEGEAIGEVKTGTIPETSTDEE